MKKRFLPLLAVLLAVLIAAGTLLSAAALGGVRGDVNGDGVCNVADALLVLRATLDGTYLPDGDIDGDGKMSLADVIRILRLAAAQPETEEYTVTFADYDGSTLKTETVEAGKDATPPADPVREGYTFIGWDGSYTNVMADVTVTACYSENSTDPAFIFGTASAKPGDTDVAVTIALKNNPGVASIALTLQYDKSALTLTGFTYNNKDKFGGSAVSFNPAVTVPKLNWVNYEAEVAEDIDFATLYFSVSPSASGSYTVSATYDPDDIYNFLEESVVFAVRDGGIRVAP